MDAATRAEHERRRAIHYKRIVEDGAIYSQPFSEGGAAAAAGVAFGTEPKPVKGGWLVNGHNGKNNILATGSTQAEAWHRAVKKAEAVGMAGGHR